MPRLRHHQVDESGADHRWGVSAHGNGRQWSGPTAGAVAGIAGLAVFLWLHARWILPIWSVAGLGLVAAVIGGASTGWAYGHLRHRVPGNLAAAWLAVTGGAVLVLLPSVVLAWLGGPYVPVVDGVPVSPSTGELEGIAIRFVLELLVVTTVTGAVVGWSLTRSRRATLATGTAALAFALGPGHNNPFFFTFGSAAAAYTGFGLMLAVVATACAILVLLDRMLVDPGRDLG